MSQATPIERELSPDASNLYIFFGGIAAGITMPPFEFYNAAKIINENKIFIRDFGQCWYHNGLPGISNDIYSTANFIQKEIQSLNPQKVFFVGCSMGGYAAILFATLIGHGEVIAFSPQTFISPFLRMTHGDRRWSKQIFNAYKRSLFKRKVWNLKPLLLRKNCNQKISIFVSKDHRIDCVHAEHIKNISGVKIYEFNGGGHGVVKLIRDEGKLPAIMAGTYV
jgi:hypothetical protein